MRKTVLMIAIIACATAMLTSCATYNSAGRSGCKATQGYVGYGSSR
jgi:predicted small secreted protein